VGRHWQPACHRAIPAAWRWSWLLGQAADWLRLADIDRLLGYAWLEGTDPGGLDYADYRAFLPAVGFRELTRTKRGWNRTLQKA